MYIYTCMSNANKRMIQRRVTGDSTAHPFQRSIMDHTETKVSITQSVDQVGHCCIDRGAP